MYANDELYHHGVRGQKWGIRRTAAQLGHKVKSAMPGGKKKGEDTKGSPKEFAKASNKGDNYANGHRTKTKMDDIVKSGDADLVYKNRHKMTNQQLQESIDRIYKEKNLKSLVDQNKSSAFDKADKFFDTASKVNGYMNTAINTYETYNKIKGMKSTNEAKAKDDSNKKAIERAKDVQKYMKTLNNEALNESIERIKKERELNMMANGTYDWSKSNNDSKKKKK